MFGDSLGTTVAPSQIIGGNGNLWTVATTKAGGTTYLTVVNRGAKATTVTIDLAGVSAVSGGTVTVLTGKPSAMNSIARPWRCPRPATGSGPPARISRTPSRRTR